MVADGLVSDGLVGPGFACEHRMLRFDGLARTGRRRDSDELAEELPAKHAVIFELGHVVAEVRFSGAPDGTG